MQGTAGDYSTTFGAACKGRNHVGLFILLTQRKREWKKILSKAGKISLASEEERAKGFHRSKNLEGGFLRWSAIG